MTDPVANTLLTARNLGKGWSERQVITGIDLDLGLGECLVILGPSGCGKTTLLHLLAGLTQSDDGEVLIRRDQAMRPPVPGEDSVTVFQTPRLLPWARAAKNIEIMLKGMPRAERALKAKALLAQVGLSQSGDAWPNQLSGGMQQRLALARALGVGAPLMLLDEPFANLDPLAREDLQDLLVSATKDTATQDTGGVAGMIFVTHSVEEALVLGDRILLMTASPGRIAAFITPKFEKEGRARRDEASFYQQLASLRAMLLDVAGRPGA